MSNHGVRDITRRQYDAEQLLLDVPRGELSRTDQRRRRNVQQRRRMRAATIRKEMGGDLWDAPTHHKNGERMTENDRYRYHETTFLLETGMSTTQVADRLGLARNTFGKFIGSTQHPLALRRAREEWAEAVSHAGERVTDPNRHGLYRAS